MGSWDCYCSLCCGPLSIAQVKLGDTKVKAILKRRKKVALEKRKRVGENVAELEQKRKATGKIVEGQEETRVKKEDDVTDEEVAAVMDEDILGARLKEADPRDPNADFIESDSEDGDYEMSSATSSEGSDDISSEDSYVHSGDADDSDILLSSIKDVPVPPLEPKSSEPRGDSWSEASELPLYDDFSFYSTRSETNSMYEYEETSSYDPSILKRANFGWLDRCRALGFNPDAPGVTKAFTTGRGRYEDYGNFDVRKPGNDLNDYAGHHYTCFYSFDSSELPVFPFHEACFTILARCLGYQDVQMVDRDVLYDVMGQHNEDYGKCLSLDFGPVTEADQFWECTPGEEFAVCDPGLKPGYQELLQGMLPSRLFHPNPTPLSLANKVKSDPWAVLPYDIFHVIVSNLSTKDILALRTASWSIFMVTADNTFWKHMLRTCISPWFWELDDFLATIDIPAKFDYKGLFLWLEKVTMPQFGLTGPMMGIANRRRIWNTSQQLVPVYRSKLSPNDYNEPEDKEAEAVFSSAVPLHTPIVYAPRTKNAETISSQFIRSWTDLNESCNFDTYWSSNDLLTGIAVTYGTHRRVFGSTDGYTGQSLFIPAGERITEIELSINELHMFDEHQDRSSWSTAMDVVPLGNSAISGMSVAMTSGKTRTLRAGHWRGKGKRCFMVLPDMCLIGLTGQVRQDGIISRLGLLQAPRPGTNTERNNLKPSYTPAQKTLWARSAQHIQDVAFIPTGLHLPIWSHPAFTIHPFTSSFNHTNIPHDMIPHELLLWGASENPKHRSSRISSLQLPGSTMSRAGPDDFTSTAPEIIALSTHQNRWHGACIGNQGPVFAQSDNWDECTFPSSTELHSHHRKAGVDDFTHFDLDAPGGELVTEVHYAPQWGALNLVTNRGRECKWGLQELDVWQTYLAVPGERIVGLSVCFGKLGGWSPGAKMCSHWALSEVGVVTVRD